MGGGTSSSLDLQKIGVTSRGAICKQSGQSGSCPDNSMDASSVYAYIYNASILSVPGMAPQKPLQFANSVNLDASKSNFSMPPANFACGGIHLFFFTVCLGEIIGNVLYNYLLVPIINTIGSILLNFITQIIMMFMQIPLSAFAAMFGQTVLMLSNPGVNPIIAIANVGTYLINMCGNLGLQILEFVALLAITPFGIFIMPVLVFVGPIILSQISVILVMGFMMAFYIPLIPFSIFVFAVIGWLVAVIEAMVAAPIVALGVVHPEGHETFGKAEGAIMILLNVFLRPAMMIIGYIGGIILSYVAVWILNQGFDRAISFIQPLAVSAQTAAGTEDGRQYGGSAWSGTQYGQITHNAASAVGGTNAATVSQAVPMVGTMQLPNAGTVTGGYNSWAGIFAFFFAIIMYITMYITIVEKAFSLITSLPDKVLRWIGGQQEQYGSEAAQWAEGAKGKMEKSAESSSAALGKMAASAGSKGAGALQAAGEKALGKGGAEIKDGGKAAGEKAAEKPGEWEKI